MKREEFVNLYREKFGSESKFSEMCGFDRTLVNKYVKGNRKPDVTAMKRMAIVLEIDFNDVFEVFYPEDGMNETNRSIKITILPAVERATSRIIRINPDTHERLMELADEMEMGVSRIADYLLNEALDRVELTVLRKEKEDGETL